MQENMQCSSSKRMPSLLFWNSDKVDSPNHSSNSNFSNRSPCRQILSARLNNPSSSQNYASNPNSNYGYRHPKPNSNTVLQVPQHPKNARLACSKSSMLESLYKCQNHKQKTATFSCSVQQTQRHYCEKCAMFLASQGYKVQQVVNKCRGSDQIQQNTQRPQSRASNYQRQNNCSMMRSRKQPLHDPTAICHPIPSYNSNSLSDQNFCHNNGQYHKNSAYNSATNSRKEEINNLLQTLIQLEKKIKEKEEESKSNLVQSSQFYGQQIQQINQYFQFVCKSLQLQKHKCYNYILNERQKAEQPLRMLATQFKESLNSIAAISSDVQENMETALQIEEQGYRLVLDQYISQLSELNHLVQQGNIQTIQKRKIQFVGVPDSIYSLSDIIIENSLRKRPGGNSMYSVDSMVSGSNMSSQMQSLSDSLHVGSQQKNKLRFSFQKKDMLNSIIQDSWRPGQGEGVECIWESRGKEGNKQREKNQSRRIREGCMQ